MVTVVPEDVAVNPASVIFAAMLVATVVVLEFAVDVPLMICMPFTVMLVTLVLPLPETLRVAVGKFVWGRAHSW